MLFKFTFLNSNLNEKKFCVKYTLVLIEKYSIKVDSNFQISYNSIVDLNLYRYIKGDTPFLG